jgi:hypothetical protein
MSNKFKITKARLAEIVREEYAAIQEELNNPSTSPAVPTTTSSKKTVSFIKEMIKKQLQDL